MKGMVHIFGTQALCLKVTMRNFYVFMKQSHDSSDSKFLVTEKETLSEKTAIFV